MLACPSNLQINSSELQMTSHNQQINLNSYNPLGLPDLWNIVTTYSLEHKEEALNIEFRLNFIRTEGDYLWYYKARALMDRNCPNLDPIRNFKTGIRPQVELSKYYWWSRGF